jgi:hypothetical protein
VYGSKRASRHVKHGFSRRTSATQVVSCAGRSLYVAARDFLELRAHEGGGQVRQAQVVQRQLGFAQRLCIGPRQRMSCLRQVCVHHKAQT